MADTVAVMNAGRIEQLGAAGELYELPAHGVRGELPRPVQPGARHGRRRPATASSASTSRARRVRRAGGRRRRRLGSRRRAGRRAAGEGAPGRRTDGSRRRGSNVLGPGTVTDVSLHRREHAVPGRRCPGPGAEGVRAEPRRGGALPAGRRGAAAPGDRAHASASPATQDAQAGGPPTRDPVPAAEPRRRRASTAALAAAAASGAAADAPGGAAGVAVPAARCPGSLYLVAVLRRAGRRAAARRRSTTGCPGGDGRPVTRRVPLANYTEALARVLAAVRPLVLLRAAGHRARAAIGYPLAYAIAVRCRGRPLLQGLLLVLVVAPFFTSFILRTIAWKQILADEACVVERPARRCTLLPEDAG